MTEPAGAMTREDLFKILAEEVFRDGIVDDDEGQLLRMIASHLNLDPVAAASISGAARRRYQAGGLGEERRFSAPDVYRDVLKAIYADGEVDDDEAMMLISLQAVLAIEDELHEKILGEIRS